MKTGYMNFASYESSTRAMDAMFVHIENLWPRGALDTPVLFLVDTVASGTQPLTYALYRGLKLVQRYPRRPLLRIAVVQTDHDMNKLIERFVHIADRLVKIGFFKAGRHDEAAAWLLSD